MQKISWKRVLKLAIPLSIISMIAVVIFFNLGSKSKLIDGDFVGKTKNEIFRSEDKSAALEKVINISRPRVVFFPEKDHLSIYP